MIARRRLALAATAVLLASPVLAASDPQPAPSTAPAGAPPQFTRFSSSELIRGFFSVAFGSDQRIGTGTTGVRKFTAPALVGVVDQGSTPHADAYRAVVREFAEKVPNLPVRLTDNGTEANVTVHLIDEAKFEGALTELLGADVTRRFIARADPQCLTSVRSAPDGVILKADIFIITDRGDSAFYDCAYHETLHAFGLSGHADRNPWTTLNQNRAVGYLTVYDRALLSMLYDPRVQPGMGRRKLTPLLPAIVASLPVPH